MAHKKGQGSTRNGRESSGQSRVIKAYTGKTSKSASNLFSQLGKSVHTDRGVRVGARPRFTDKSNDGRGVGRPPTAPKHRAILRCNTSTINPRPRNLRSN